MHSKMEDFLTRLEGQDKADSTVRNYANALEQYSMWLDNQGLDVLEVDYRDIQKYLSHLKNNRELAPKTIRLKYKSLSRFYKDLTGYRAEYDDPTYPIKLSNYASNTTKREEVTKEKHIWLKKGEINQLADNVPSPRIRNRLAILLQYFCGLRRQEVVDIKVDDLDREKRQIRVRGKGDKLNTAYYQPELDSLMSAWLDRGYRDGYATSMESDHLFITFNTPKLSADRYNDIIVEAAKEAGIQEVLFEDAAGTERYKVTSHILRHSFAIHFLNAGGDIEDLQQILAHSSVETTEVYAEVLDERAKEAYEKYAPSLDLDGEF